MEFKIILYGDFGVGKTALTYRLLRNGFDPDGSSTIGASFSAWKPEIVQGDISQRVTFGIWDTAGQERFHTLLPLYLRDADAVIHCWDYNVQFDPKKALEMYTKAKDHAPECLYYFVMTKTDKNEKNRAYNQTAECWVKDKELAGCYYTSSLSGFGVRELFTEIARTLVKTRPLKQDNTIIDVSKDPVIDEKKCCN